jgi:hypothetical protein
MDSPGSYFLLINGTDFVITAPTTYVGDWLTDLDGMVAASVLLDFRSATGPQLLDGDPYLRAYLQTSLDDGNSVIDLACVVFQNGNQQQVFNIAADGTSPAPMTATDGTLADNTILGGLLGNRLRLKCVTQGTWVNTYLGGRVVVR